MRRVVLVGFMAAGKSTIGARLARRLGWDFLDMDRRIEERLGLSVAEAFARLGEPAFRAEEEAVARELQGREALVVAAGGGAFAEQRTRALLRTDALCVWLRVPLAVIEARIGLRSDRPLAANRARIPALYALREPSYALADAVVDVGHGTPDEEALRVFEVVQVCLVRRGPEKVK
jgi:shikimate kinase/3-dehydroquinate synthase